MKLREITDIIESIAPLSLQESYDNSGLIVGHDDDEISGGVLLAVDVTEDVIQEAIDKGCQMIISHHPIVFHPLKRFNSACVEQRCVELAIKNDIALYACHTNLDSAMNGMSFRLSEILGLRDVQPLQSVYKEGGAGFGTIGTTDREYTIEEYLKLVKERLSLDAVRYSVPAGNSVRRVAVCTGAGASLMGDAAKNKCDVYITSDLKYNDFYTPQKRFTVFDVGHFESEKCAIDILFDILSKKITIFALHKSANSVNPVKYFL